jgi:hypothetical protein
VAFLRSRQRPDGAFRLDPREVKNDAAMTALCALAMVAAGHQPVDATDEGRSVRDGLRFLLDGDRQDADGYFGRRDGSRMYGHGIVTLLLAEMLGMGVDQNQDRRIREACEKAVRLILKAQRVEGKGLPFIGGWRYLPDAPDSDLSVTVWQVAALRSAQNAGLAVPSAAIANATRFLKVCYDSNRDAQGRPTREVSACSYRPGSAPEFTTGACGLLAFQVCGYYDLPEVRGSADWLLGRDPDPGKWFYYGCFYFAQGMHQMGGHYAEHARTLLPGVMLPLQQEDGSFRAIHAKERDAGELYTTALAVLALAVDYHYLPIYQR